MNLDLSAYTRLALNILSAPGEFIIKISFKDNSFFQHEFELGPLCCGSGNGPSLYEFPIPGTGSGFEPNKVGGIKVSMSPFDPNFPFHNSTYNGPGLYRFESLVAVVPEPRAYALCSAIGLVTFAIFRRNRHSIRRRLRKSVQSP
jgi:hypothetical protein